MNPPEYVVKRRDSIGMAAKDYTRQIVDGSG
eukprot:CAMPEP_0170470532 /NCGR_PEP_ID=MMETSP0123-20130129/12962_1 /TAXON_ID=182087 /ORGANISM="Favella ehrenbergii, Strain Fehren 1" /LENGTH=30 /DNA_ID= /DNA_START= /DNA_END= /DNA_ORIENTATION=